MNIEEMWSPESNISILSAVELSSAARIYIAIQQGMEWTCVFYKLALVLTDY
jgi:hypothetical protein